MLLAALSSCHMLSFLAIAAREVTEDSYQEIPGLLENNGGKWWLARVILQPKVKSDADAAQLAEIHHLAHEACFIANSVKLWLQSKRVNPPRFCSCARPKASIING